MSEQIPPDPNVGQAAPVDGLPSQDARNMAMLAHLLGIVTGPIGALVIWLIKKDQEPYVDDQAKEAINFQITFLIAWVAAILITILTCGVGAPLLLVVFVGVLVFSILAGLAASRGERYRYPVNIRLVK